MTLQKLSAGRGVAILTMVVTVCAALAQGAGAQERSLKRPAREIPWLVTWKQALEEARRTEKPILLAFGKPACEGVPGLW